MALFDKKEKTSADSDISVSVGRAGNQHDVEADGVFGQAEDGAPNYVNVGWFRASILLMKAQIGLGVLGIPQVFSTIGLIPGVIVILVLAAITAWSSLVVARFKLRHPEVHSIADVGYILLGSFGREFFGAIYWLYMICISGSGMLGVSIALNTLSEHGTCTVVFVAVAAIAVFLLSSIQTLDRVSILGWIGLVSILVSMLTVTIAVGLQERPAAAPAYPAFYDINFKLFGSPTFAEAGSSLGTIVFAYGGVPATFNLVAEMRKPSDFPKTLAVTQTFVTVTYIVIGVVIYYYCGDYVASPALGSAGLLIKKISYGIAIPALIIGAVIYTHLPAKYVFVRLLRGTRHLASNTTIHWVAWLGSVGFATVIAFVIAEGIPVFSGLVGLVGALFGTIMSIQIMGAMWLYDEHWGIANAEKRVNSTFRYKAIVAWSYFLIIAGSFVTIAGTYGAISGIISDYSGQKLTAFACADNSG